MTGKPIDKTVFALAVVTSLLVSIPLILFSNSIGPGIVELYDWTASNLGIIYQWAAIGAMAVAAYLAFGPYGHIKLGATDEEVSEMLGVSVYMGGGPSLMYAADAWTDWQQTAG